MPTKIIDATDEDLEWFDLDKYQSLESANILTWSKLIRDRVGLTLAINSYRNPQVNLLASELEGVRQYCLAQFERIKQNPMASLGFAKRSYTVPDESNTKTVNSISTKRLRFLADSIDASTLDWTLADLELQKAENYPLSQYANVTVNLNASNEDIKRDFATWLKKYRDAHVKSPSDDHRNKIKTWEKHKLLQCKDLLLFEAITGKRITWLRIVSMIDDSDQMQSRPNQDQNRIKTLRNYVENIFQDEICDILENSQD